MKAQKTRACGFRLWQANADKLDKARSVGLNGTDIVNELLDKHLEDYIRQKAHQISRAFLKAA